MPQSLCSWDFRVLDSAGSAADLTFNFFSEQGSIVWAGQILDVRKHGWLSGRWSLEGSGNLGVEAYKPGALFRCFEIRDGRRTWTLKAQSPLTRSYDILSGGVSAGRIWPAHPFTRRAFIECEASVPDLVQLFAFWLAVLTWRRAAQNSSASSSS